MSEEKEITYEEALLELKSIVTKLESGSIPLEATIKYFEKGQKLLKFCQEQLSKAEGKLFKLNKDGSLEDIE